MEWIRSFEPESIYWDIGASVGPYALIAAALGHTVYAFEPYGPSHGELCRNSIINRLDTHPLPVAIGKGERIGRMPTITHLPGVAGSALSEHEESRYLPMLTVTADDMADQIGVPTHVKIDVDGRELDVIESGRELWPLVETVMVECDNKTRGDVSLVLGACGMEQVESWTRSADMRNHLFRRMK